VHGPLSVLCRAAPQVCFVRALLTADGSLAAEAAAELEAAAEGCRTAASAAKHERWQMPSRVAKRRRKAQCVGLCAYATLLRTGALALTGQHWRATLAFRAAWRLYSKLPPRAAFGCNTVESPSGS
jgi:hypothetical protein